MRTVTLANGEKVPQLGLGTWHMGERGGQRAAEAKALTLGLDLGLGLIDTAEMYGEGGAEEVISDVLPGRRDKVYLVSKVYPHNASRRGAIAACERSLKRLKTGHLDMYLLHWRGSHPLAETVEAFEQLKRDGKIRQWGVSNLDVDDMQELAAVRNGDRCLVNQVLYHPGGRGIEFDLVPHASRSGVAIMAYSPLGQGSVLGNRTLAALAQKHKVTPAAVALAWVMRHPHVIAIPKATRLEHVRENAAALSIELDADDLQAIDAAFPPPGRKRPLAML